jgi:hypothetical protein
MEDQPVMFNAEIGGRAPLYGGSASGKSSSCNTAGPPFPDDAFCRVAIRDDNNSVDACFFGHLEIHSIANVGVGGGQATAQ